MPKSRNAAGKPKTTGPKKLRKPKATVVKNSVTASNVTKTTIAPAEADQQALDRLDQKLLVARDRIRQVGRGEAPGFYWHGRPGTGKTHTVLTTLKEMSVQHHYHKGHVTAQGLLRSKRGCLP